MLDNKGRSVCDNFVFEEGNIVKIINTTVSGDKTMGITYQGGSFIINHELYNILSVFDDKAIIGSGAIAIASVNVENIALASEEDISKANEYKNSLDINIGDKVNIIKGSRSYNGLSLAEALYKNIYTVRNITGDRAALSLSETGAIITAVKLKDLVKYER